MKNQHVTQGAFLLPSEVRNICKKRVEEFDEKHSNPIRMHMWVHENPESMFFYQEHNLLNLNKSNQDDTPFTLDIKCEWQQQMMARYGHNNELQCLVQNKPRWVIYMLEIACSSIELQFELEFELVIVLEASQFNMQNRRKMWCPSSINMITHKPRLILSST